MGCRTYEADKHGRITIYPSLNSDRGKSPGMLRWLKKKLMDMVGATRHKGTGMPQA